MADMTQMALMDMADGHDGHGRTRYAACQPHVNIWWHPPAGPKNSRAVFRTSSLATGPAVINKVVGEETYVVVSDEGEKYDVVRPTSGVGC